MRNPDLRIVTGNRCRVVHLRGVQNLVASPDGPRREAEVTVDK